jgi:hypothetical protein
MFPALSRTAYSPIGVNRASPPERVRGKGSAEDSDTTGSNCMPSASGVRPESLAPNWAAFTPDSG